jgi:hypothetical protein
MFSHIVAAQGLYMPMHFVTQQRFFAWRNVLVCIRQWLQDVYRSVFTDRWESI